MTSRPRSSLSRVLDDLGATLLTLVQGQPGWVPEIGGVVIHDPVDRPALPPCPIVLGVGLVDPDDVVALLGTLGQESAGALVLRAPAPVDDRVRAAVEATQIVLLEVARGVPWGHLNALLRGVLADGDIGAGDAESLGGLPSGDLFSVANAIAALLDAPVTIEDRHLRVLAFSGRQDEADPSRVETVLGRQVPERYSRLLKDRGVFRDLYRSDQPVVVAPVPDELEGFSMHRLAVAVRAGDELLGSLWAAVHDPPDDEQLSVLVDSAKLVALHMLRVRAGADVGRRLQIDLLSSALEGGTGAREALDRLGLADQPVMVLGLAAAGTAPPPDEMDGETSLTHQHQRVGDAFALHLSAVHPRAVAATLGDVTYGLMPVSGNGTASEAYATSVAKEFLDRVGDRARVCVATGPMARDVTEMAHARACVDRVLRVLREAPRGRRVAGLADVQAESLMLELGDTVRTRGETMTGPIARLAEHDRERGTCLVDTLRAWLDAFGDVRAAGEALYVHPNTVRYRLGTIAEVGDIDLADPETRFVAMLQLRLLPPTTA